MSRVVMHPDVLQQFINNPGGPVQQYHQKSIRTFRAFLLGFTPKHMRKSIKQFTNDVGGVKTTVFLVTAPDAAAREYGTQEYPIYPRNKKALAFDWKVKGRTLVPKGGSPTTGQRGDVFIIGKGFVIHPPQKARPFFALAVAAYKAARGGRHLV